MRASYRTDGLAHNIKSAHVPNALGKAYYRNELTDHELHNPEGRVHAWKEPTTYP